MKSFDSSLRKILVTLSLICHLFSLHYKLKSHQFQQPFVQLLAFGYHEPRQVASHQKEASILTALYIENTGVIVGFLRDLSEDHMFKGTSKAG
ncbi:uncharacterized protein [Nicotiana sylvestris]|uniref:uncharacterized protein n=1 Tax=Nicotiana sylvestris TaxID=4096 RepID=UPI00388C534B